jgi:hypothetical protein
LATSQTPAAAASRVGSVVNPGRDADREHDHDPDAEMPLMQAVAEEIDAGAKFVPFEPRTQLYAAMTW